MQKVYMWHNKVVVQVMGLICPCVDKVRSQVPAYWDRYPTPKYTECSKCIAQVRVRQHKRSALM